MVRLVGSFLVLSVADGRGGRACSPTCAREASLQTSIYNRLDAAVEQKSGAINSWIDDQRRNVVFVGQLLGGTESSGDPQLKRLSQELLSPDDERSDAAQGARHDPADPERRRQPDRRRRGVPASSTESGKVAAVDDPVARGRVVRRTSRTSSRRAQGITAVAAGHATRSSPGSRRSRSARRSSTRTARRSASLPPT